MGAKHILAHAGFYLLPYRDAIDRLANARGANDGCLILALRTALWRRSQASVSSARPRS